jgi:predicted nucleic acid-binding protein
MTPTTNTVVVDASVAVKWHLEDEDDAEIAAALLDRFTRGEIILIAPDHIRYEVPSAITLATVRAQPRLTRDQGQAAIQRFLAMGLVTVGDDALILAAFPLVHQHKIAFYDAQYLALAERVGCPLVTADRKLYLRIGHLAAVKWIGDGLP